MGRRACTLPRLEGSLGVQPAARRDGRDRIGIAHGVLTSPLLRICTRTRIASWTFFDTLACDPCVRSSLDLSVTYLCSSRIPLVCLVFFSLSVIVFLFSCLVLSPLLYLIRVLTYNAVAYVRSRPIYGDHSRIAGWCGVRRLVEDEAERYLELRSRTIKASPGKTQPL